jgi:hypothetical protein
MLVIPPLLVRLARRRAGLAGPLVRLRLGVDRVLAVSSSAERAYEPRRPLVRAALRVLAPCLRARVSSGETVWIWLHPAGVPYALDAALTLWTARRTRR